MRHPFILTRLDDFGYSVEEDSKDTSRIPQRKRDPIHKIEDMLLSKLDRKDFQTVIHLHGTLEEPDKMILTNLDYINCSGRNDVKAEENSVPKFLEQLFERKNILFIGYGLEELEILEYLILKGKSKQAYSQKSPSLKHFILQPFFSHENLIVEEMKSYFETECGVQLLPFLRDHQDYDALIHVIENFLKDIRVVPTLSIEKRNRMRNLLDD